MSSQAVSDGRIEPRLFTNPWPAFLVGLLAITTGVIWLELARGQGNVAAVNRAHTVTPPLILGGLLAIGVAVAIRPQSSLVLSLAALSGLLAIKGLAWESTKLLEAKGLAWDSARMLIFVLSLVALLAAILVALPRVVRRCVMSLLVVLHFGGILSAVLSPPPTPWIANVAWTYFYRPYLEFVYLINAYHFYSPEPGPGALIWFYVSFEDGAIQEYKIPNHEENPVALEYQRRLSMCESVNQLLPVGPIPDFIRERRRVAILDTGIPTHPEVMDTLQWRPPIPFSRRMLETYARHVARHVKHPTDPNIKMTGVKVYRIVHAIVGAKQIKDGVKPNDKWLYYPYYQGEYDLDGKLKDPTDPFLYWLIPIFKEPMPLMRTGGAFRLQLPGEGGPDELVADFLERHVHLKPRSNKAGHPGGEDEADEGPAGAKDAAKVPRN